MARQQSVARLGFYPFPEAALPLLCKHLQPAAGLNMLDPCAGKAVAAGALADHLGVVGPNLHLVELAANRGAEIKLARPDATLLSPCSFLGTVVTFNSFSVVYVNPPYSDEMGGGRREELTFFNRAAHLVAPGGVIVAVMPEPTVFDYGHQSTGMRAAIDSRFEKVEVYPLPAEHRNFREMVIFGVKRKQPVPAGSGPLTRTAQWWHYINNRPELGNPETVYKPPPGSWPKRFLKVDFTPEEMIEKVLASPLAKLLLPPKPIPRRSPPMPLSKGHIAIVLAAGDLDGLIFPEGEPPHVIRGTAEKITVRNEEKCEVNEHEDGSYSTKEVLIEEVKLCVRAIDTHGRIHEFTDKTKPEPVPT